jgi:hypothetical protein
MKSLPERSYYDIKSAARLLNISVDDLNFHLREGNLKYAFTPDAFDSQTIIPVTELPETTQRQIERVLKRPEAIDIHDIAAPTEVFNRYSGAHHDFLYLQHNELKQCLAIWSEPEAYRGFVMYLADKTAVAIFNQDGRLHGAWLGDINDDGVLSEAVISAEEIAEYLPNINDDTHQNHPEHSQSDSDAPLPFSTGERADDARKAIAEMGNEYFKKFGKSPTPKQLRNFMVEQSPTPWLVIDQPNGRAEFLSIEDYTLSYDAFKSRYKRVINNL